MCGIFGCIASLDSSLTPTLLKKITDKLFTLSESRGKEASGIAIRTKNSIQVFKLPTIASCLISSKTYSQIFQDLYKKLSNGKGNCTPIAILGHSRLVTSGSQELNSNNQPVIKDGIIGVHNGIVVNDYKLWQSYSELKQEYHVDTEIILSLFRMYLGKHNCFVEATKKTYSQIQGSASIALLSNCADSVIFATNTGSFYMCSDKHKTSLIFASERYILNKTINELLLSKIYNPNTISQLRPGEGYHLNINDCTGSRFLLAGDYSPQNIEDTTLPIKIKELSDADKDHLNLHLLSTNNHLTKEVKDTMFRTWENLYKREGLRRCARCILPETMTFIDFDENGVCNYCRHFKKAEILGMDALENILKHYRSNEGNQDCIVSLSGGRDSCYGLHCIKTRFGMNPIAFTYDWGVVTDLARRNMARMCGKLGVEHIVVSADIRKKRRNIRKNIEAWLKKPELGMIPLLMAGDKQMLYYASRLMKQTHQNLLIYSIGNGLEHCPLKIGLSGVLLENFKPHGSIHWKNKIKYLSYYAYQYLLNPAYFNVSFIDTIWAFLCTFVMKENNLHLYEYIPWEEKEVNSTLIDEYDWEIASDTRTTWRIGDGTAGFYNYIYLATTGMTEHDTFRSNQIREGAITRKEAMDLIPEDNKPRHDSVAWYSNTIGFDGNNAIKIINNIPKRYTCLP